MIVTQEWLANELAVEIADGTKWNSGFSSSAFVTDRARSLAWSEQPYLLFTNLFLERSEQIVPIMQQLASVGAREFVVIAPKISDSALATLLVNNERGTLHSLGIIAPGSGAHRVDVLQDLAAQTGGRFLSADAGDRVEQARLTDLGSCERVWASRDFFAVIGGDGDPAMVDERVQGVRAALATADAPYDRDLLRRRLGQLTGGLAILSVGAATKSEMLERRARADRAIRAVESARRCGVVPGGGVALVACARAIDGSDERLPLDEKLGRLALAQALEEPLRVIASNAGAAPSPVLEAVRQGGGRICFDAVQARLVDVDASGLFDPFDVVKTALSSGVSAAVMAMLTEALVIPKYRYLHADPHP